MDRDEELTYRSPMPTGTATLASARDENEYSTLVEIKKLFESGIAGLYKDFNAFKVDKGPAEVARQVTGRQLAYDILIPLFDQVSSAVEDIERKNRGQ